MKTIGILLPCYNERGNVRAIAEDIKKEFSTNLVEYDYMIVFIDNDSTDGTQQILEQLCSEDSKIAAIFNTRNFNYYSSWYGIKNTPGDCVIQIPSDRQVPVSVIPQMIHEWESGSDFVCAIKNTSEENPIMWHMRQLFYKMSRLWMDIKEPLNNLVATLYDRTLLDAAIQTNDSMMFKSLRVYMTSYCKNLSKVYVTQEVRKEGKSKNGFGDLIRIGMIRMTENSASIPFHLFILGLFVLFLSFVSSIAYVAMICNGILQFDFGIPLILLFAFLFGYFIILCSLMANYILKINDRVAHWPGVVEKKRINL